MNDKQLLALYGLKWNPFLPNIPVEALWSPPQIDSFFFRVENLVMDGGFALICGEPGLGKSKNLQLLAQRLNRMGEVVVGVMERPQSNLSDFYREMGALFGVSLSPANRYEARAAGSLLRGRGLPPGLCATEPGPALRAGTRRAQG